LLPVHYPTTHTPKSNDFFFATETGHSYRVYFDTKTGSHPNEAIDKLTIYLGFICTPKQEPFSRIHDSKIGSTIMWIVANMFKAYKHAIISYVCSPEDGQARARLITFGKWYNESPLKEKITHLPKRIGRDNCFGIMYSKKHPLIEQIEFAFHDFDPENKFGYALAEDEVFYELDDFDEENETDF
jgi:hypothetical protein